MEKEIEVEIEWESKQAFVGPCVPRGLAKAWFVHFHSCSSDPHAKESIDVSVHAWPIPKIGSGVHGCPHGVSLLSIYKLH